MPRLTLTAAQGWQTVGPLAATTDFQVLSGSINITGETPVGLDYGHVRYAGGNSDSIQFGAGKTVSIRTDGNATIQYEALA